MPTLPTPVPASIAAGSTVPPPPPLRLRSYISEGTRLYSRKSEHVAADNAAIGRWFARGCRGPGRSGPMAEAVRKHFGPHLYRHFKNLSSITGRWDQQVTPAHVDDVIALGATWEFLRNLSSYDSATKRRAVDQVLAGEPPSAVAQRYKTQQPTTRSTVLKTLADGLTDAEWLKACALLRAGLGKELVRALAEYLQKQ